MRPPATAPSPTASVGSPASRVMELVRRRGVIKREELARRTGLSTATVARAVSALVEAGLLRYAIDRTSDRGVGRPGTPLEVDTRRFVVVGVHLGRRVATVALGDLSGQVLDTRLSPHRSLMVAELGALVTELLASVPARQPLAAGVVAPWQALGWDRSRVEDEVHDLLGLDVSSDEHITAMARAEFLASDDSTGSTAFVYARETAGFLVADQTAEGVHLSRETSLNHFPTGSDAACECGRTGCLIASAGDMALALRAASAGWIEAPRIELLFRAAAAGNVGARGLLAERARILQDVTGHVADMCAPDRIVLAGQAFTADPAVLRGSRRTLTPQVSSTRFGAAIQANAACAVALGPVDRDPLGLAPRPVIASA